MISNVINRKRITTLLVIILLLILLSLLKIGVDYIPAMQRIMMRSHVESVDCYRLSDAYITPDSDLSLMLYSSVSSDAGQLELIQNPASASSIRKDKEELADNRLYSGVIKAVGNDKYLISCHSETGLLITIVQIDEGTASINVLNKIEVTADPNLACYSDHVQVEKDIIVSHYSLVSEERHLLEISVLRDELEGSSPSISTVTVDDVGVRIDTTGYIHNSDAHSDSNTQLTAWNNKLYVLYRKYYDSGKSAGLRMAVLAPDEGGEYITERKIEISDLEEGGADVRSVRLDNILVLSHLSPSRKQLELMTIDLNNEDVVDTLRTGLGEMERTELLSMTTRSDEVFVAVSSRFADNVKLVRCNVSSEGEIGDSCRSMNIALGNQLKTNLDLEVVDNKLILFYSSGGSQNRLIALDTSI